MAKVTHHDNGKISINRSEAFAEAINGRSPFEIADFNEFIEGIEEDIRQDHPGVSRGALNNARGEWYEALIALGANEFASQRNTPLALIRLPNVNAFSCEDLYIPEISDLICELRATLRNEADVSLISSNPDFVVISSDVLNIPNTRRARVQELRVLDLLYQNVTAACSFEHIAAYCSVKSGLRPDRRLQIAHEGSLMKALYRHIQTRLWAIAAPGIKYYGITGSCGEADREALKTVATHSIVDVLGRPESAVDELFAVNSGIELEDALAHILQA